MNTDDDMFKFMMTNNLNWVVRFHNHVKNSLKQSKKEFSESDEIKQGDKDFWGHVYKDTFPKQLRTTTFLLMFGNLEEMLYLLWKKQPSNTIELARGNGITKYKPFIKHCLNGALGSSKEYSFISNASEIRNSILHVAGRISLMREPVKLRKIIECSNGLYIDKSDRIEISAEALSELQISISELLEKIHSSVMTVEKNA
jgi:hypothetical protein